MSTVDAAIINYITNGGGSSGGGSGGSPSVVYTAGDGISLTNNKIAVRYNANTMEIINGVLSAKISGGSEGGGGSSGGGSGSTEEIMTHLTAVQGTHSSTNILLQNIEKRHLRTGLRLRWRLNDIDMDFVLVVSNYDFPKVSTSGTQIESNGIFASLSTDYNSVPVKIYMTTTDQYTIQIDTENGAQTTFWTEDGRYGLFEVQQHTPLALTTMFMGDILYRQMNEQRLINYLQTTVEALKNKVGI